MMTCLRYKPFFEVQAGMVLGESVSISDQGYLCISLPEGHALTQDNLRQLASHHAEYVVISEPDTRSEIQIAIDATETKRRVSEIFSCADLANPTIAALFEQVLAYKSL